MGLAVSRTGTYMELTFRLKDFDGPLDLLLTLVNKAQIDIREIFVSEITDQYLAIVRAAPDLDMDEASDFLVMAATLIEIKSRSMLPRPPVQEEGEEDPEAELIRRLEEYRRFKESAEGLRVFEEAARHVFTRLPEEFPLPPQETELTNLTLEALTEAFRRLLERRSDAEEELTNHYAPRDIRRDVHTVRECMLDLLRLIRKKKEIHFEEAFSAAPTREEVVTFFLAMLELLRLGRMHVHQQGPEGDILLTSGRPSLSEEDMREEDPDLFGRKKRKKRMKTETEEDRTETAGAPEGEQGMDVRVDS